MSKECRHSCENCVFQVDIPSCEDGEINPDVFWCEKYRIVYRWRAIKPKSYYDLGPRRDDATFKVYPCPAFQFRKDRKPKKMVILEQGTVL